MHLLPFNDQLTSCPDQCYQMAISVPDFRKAHHWRETVMVGSSVVSYVRFFNRSLVCSVRSGPQDINLR
jgi:hypothetical protein